MERVSSEGYKRGIIRRAYDTIAFFHFVYQGSEVAVMVEVD